VSRYVVKTPTCEDEQLAQTETAAVLRELKLDMEAPVVKQSLLDRHYTSVMPFWDRTRFVQPYSLSSRAPFASVPQFCFVRVDDHTDRLLYANNTDQLYVTVQRQAHALYSPDLGRKALLGGGVNFGFDFLARVYIVGGMFEVMQCWCNQPSHLQWSHLYFEEREKCKERAKCNLLQGVAVPVLNPGHRNVLEDSDGANLLLTVRELGDALQNAKGVHLTQALHTNASYNSYGNECLAAILQSRIVANSQNDFEQMNVSLEKIKYEFTAKLHSPSLYDVETNAAFVPKKEASLCEYPFTDRFCEPATSINAFAPWNSATDFAIKHCNASQLFGQQMLRNPICMYLQPQRVYTSLTGPVQMDGRFFIGHTNMFVGAYKQPVREQPHSPEVNQLRATVALQAVAVVNKEALDSRVNSAKARFQQDMEECDRRTQRKQLWKDCELLLVEQLEQLVQALLAVEPDREQTLAVDNQFLGQAGKKSVADLDQQQCKQLKEQHDQNRQRHSAAMARKVDAFKQCRPLLYTQFQINGRYQGFFTNLECDYGQRTLRLRRLRKEKKVVFTSALCNAARRDHYEPTLPHVAKLVDPDVHAMETLNWTGFFDDMQETPHPAAGDPLHAEPWYPLFHMYKESTGLLAGNENVQLIDITVLVQAQNTALSTRELLAEHQLCNMSASDFGSHSAIPHDQAATFFRWVYQSLLVTRQVQVARLHVESFKRVTLQQVTAMKEWGKGMNEHISSQALFELQKRLPAEDMKKLSHALHSVAELVKREDWASVGQMLVHEAFKLLRADPAEEAFSTMELQRYHCYKKTHGGSEKDDEQLWQCVLMASRFHLIPFFVLTQNYNPQFEDEGLISTRFLVSLRPSNFKQYLNQLGHAAWAAKPLVNFDRVVWPAACDSRKLELLFDRLLTRALNHYLLRCSLLEAARTERILLHADTRLNFAVLIGCSLYAEPEDISGAKRQAIKDGFLEGPFPRDDDEASLEYYGHLIRVELLMFCRRLQVPDAQSLAALGVTLSELQEQMARFEKSRTHGFGAPQPDEQEPGDEEHKAPRKRAEKEETKRLWRDSDSPPPRHTATQRQPPIEPRVFKQNEHRQLTKGPKELLIDIRYARESHFDKPPELD